MSENTEIIVVKQLPIIEERLKQVSAEIDIMVAKAKSLVCTEDTVKEIKKTRTALSKQFSELEEQRKTVKNAVMTPYNSFELVYKNCISGKFKAADADLKAKIDAVEDELKNVKAKEVQDYFTELCAVKEIDFASWEQSGINVTLSASKKTLKEQAKDFVEHIVDDLEVISAQTHKNEVLAEYKPTLNLSASIKHVNEIHERIEAEQKRQEEREAEKQRQAEAREQAEREAKQTVIIDTEMVAPPIKISPPVEISVPVEITPPEQDIEEILQLSFVVRATKSKLKELKQFLINGEYDYE